MEMFLERFLREPGSYEARLRAFPAVFSTNGDDRRTRELNYGGKILLPNSVLDQLVRLNIQYPMLFKLTNMDCQRSTHCGVLEFSADEGKCYLPSWMMRQLKLREGDLISIQYVSLPSATYAKFKPQSTSFLQISNPRAVLEVELRKFACLTKNDIIAVEYNDEVLKLKVVEVQPSSAVTIIECDMNVEFDAPEGYVEEDNRVGKKEMPEPSLKDLIKSGNPFEGKGRRLDGKESKRTPHVSECQEEKVPEIYELRPLEPNNEYKPGYLTFPRYNYKSRVVLERELAEKQQGPSGSGFKPFEGAGYTIRSRR